MGGLAFRQSIDQTVASRWGFGHQLGRGLALELEWYFIPERGELMINITDVFGVDFENVLTEFEKEYSWTGADYFTEKLDDGEIEQWVWLLGATKRSNDSNSGNPSVLVTAARSL